MIRRIRTVLRQDRGATAAEYALIASLIAVVVLGAVAFLGGRTSALFSTTGSSFASLP